MVIKQLQMLSATNRPMPFWRDGRAWLPSDCFATQNEVLHLPSFVGGVDWPYSAPASADFVSTMATDYPPDLQEDAVKTVLQQAELLCADWAAESHGNF